MRNTDNHNGKLSKGCQLCQQGEWLCIFLTYKCNAGCHFCPVPFKKDIVHSAFGNQKEKIISYLHSNDFKGISFSGGDPFIQFERLWEWQTFFKQRLPHYYYWVYTNGLLTTLEYMQKIASAGMDEIRFNIAATGYISAQIMEKIKIARDLFAYVSVEIPSIKNDYHLLEASLVKLEQIGIDYLNLHDLILVDQDSESRQEPGKEFLLNKTIPLKYAVSSVQNTENIIKLSNDKGFHFQINHCSMEKKELQMTQRRMKMGKIFMDPDYDIVQKDGTVINFYGIPLNAYSDELLKKFHDPAFCLSYRAFRIKEAQFNDFFERKDKIIKVTYIPKMEIDSAIKILDIRCVNFPAY